jgi:hypothetical protein
MSGWSATEVALVGKVVSGVVANEPISKEPAVTAGGALNGIFKLKVSAVTQAGTITPKLQSANGDDWVDIKAGAVITASGTQYIRWNIEVAADQAVLPLLNKCRLVLTTTNASDSVTIDSCELLQEL